MRSIIGAYVEITGACNEKCPYCYNEKLVNSENALPLMKLSAVIRELRENGISNVAFSGGEPFLFDGFERVLQEASDLGMGLRIISNGVCFEEENLPLLRRFQPGLQVTFDGWDASSHDCTRGIGNFAKITTGIKNARQNGFIGDVAVRVNLQKGNIAHVAKILDMLQELFDVDNEAIRDVGSIDIALLRKTDSDSGNFAGYLEIEEYKQYPEIFELFADWNHRHTAQITHEFSNADISCPYNADFDDVKCGIRIALDGNVFPCQAFIDNVFSIGNIHNETLKEIMNGTKLAEFVDAVHGRQGSISQCQACGYVSMCAGGCPAQAFIENRTLNSVSARCDSRKAHFNIALQSIMKHALQKTAPSK